MKNHIQGQSICTSQLWYTFPPAQILASDPSAQQETATTIFLFPRHDSRTCPVVSRILCAFVFFRLFLPRTAFIEVKQLMGAQPARTDEMKHDCAPHPPFFFLPPRVLF